MVHHYFNTRATITAKYYYLFQWYMYNLSYIATKQQLLAKKRTEAKNLCELLFIITQFLCFLINGDKTLGGGEVRVFEGEASPPPPPSPSRLISAM